MRSKTVTALAVVILTLGLAMAVGGVVGGSFTYSQAAAENITTPEDASIPEAAVRGPWTMKAQADIILDHTLHYTDGQRYSEMSQDDEARPLWVTSTTLRTALHMGIMAYAIAAFAVAVGMANMAVGATLLLVNRR